MRHLGHGDHGIAGARQVEETSLGHGLGGAARQVPGDDRGPRPGYRCLGQGLPDSGQGGVGATDDGDEPHFRVCGHGRGDLAEQGGVEDHRPCCASTGFWACPNSEIKGARAFSVAGSSGAMGRPSCWPLSATTSHAPPEVATTATPGRAHGPVLAAR